MPNLSRPPLRLPDGGTVSRTQLAQALGISRQTLGAWLKRKPLETILAHRQQEREHAVRPQDAVCYWCPTHQCFAWHRATLQPWQALTQGTTCSAPGGHTILIKTPCPTCTAGHVERSA